MSEIPLFVTVAAPLNSTLSWGLSTRVETVSSSCEKRAFDVIQRQTTRSVLIILFISVEIIDLLLCLDFWALFVFFELTRYNPYYSSEKQIIWGEFRCFSRCRKQRILTLSRYYARQIYSLLSKRTNRNRPIFQPETSGTDGAVVLFRRKKRRFSIDLTSEKERNILSIR